MIINKTCLRLLCVCALCALLFSACATDGAQYPYEDLMTDSETERQETTNLWRIVVSSDCSPTLLTEARLLASELKRITDVRAEVAYDGDAVTEPHGVSEILLGQVERNGVAERMKRLRRDDYICRMVGDRLVIGGKEEAATLAALERFRAEILPAATAELLMHPDGGFEYVGVYEIGAVSVNGFELCEYQLVLPDDPSESLKTVAETLRDRIAEKSDYALTVVSDDRYDGGKAIFLTVQEDGSGSRVARILSDTKGITLCAADSFGVSVAAEAFLKELFAAETENGVSYTAEQTKSYPYERFDYRIGTVLVDGLEALENPLALTAISDAVNQKQPDAVLFGSMGVTQNQQLASNLEGYRFCGDGAAQAPAYEKGISMTLLGVYSLREELILSAYRLGSESRGVLLVRISGRVTEQVSVTLPEAVANIELPMLVVTHVQTDGGALRFDRCADYGMGEALNETFSYFGDSYEIACYGTNGAFRVAAGASDARLGYLELTVERTTVLS